MIYEKTSARCLFCNESIDISKGGLCVYCRDERWKSPRRIWLQNKGLKFIVEKYLNLCNTNKLNSVKLLTN